MRCFRRGTTRIWGWATDRRLPAATTLAAAGLAIAAVATSLVAADGAPRAGAAPAADAPEADKVAVFMRAKLAHADRVLEGLAVEDYAMIERAAQELALASLDSNWQVLQTEDYLRQSGEFRRSCESLKKAAQEKNLDGGGDVERLRAAACRLAPRERTLVELLLAGKTQAVIAHVLGVSERTVSRLRQRVIESLRRILEP